MSSQLFRQYIDFITEQEAPEWQKRARDIAMKMGVIAPHLANIEYKDNVPVRINGDPVPDHMYSPEERAKVKGQGAAGSSGAAAPGKSSSATQVQTDDDGNHMITTPDGKTIVVGPDGKPLPNGGRVTPPTTSGGQSASPSSGNRVIDLQRELKAKGADLGNFGPEGDGVDGKIGKFTREAAKKHPEIAAKYKDVLDGGQAASPAQGSGSSGSGNKPAGGQPAASGDNAQKLNNALSGLEQILKKYKVDVKEEIDHILENINVFSEQEQIEIWKLITEEDKPKLPPGAKYDRSTGNWYTEKDGKKVYIGGSTTTTPAKSLDIKPQSKFSKFISKLGGASGIGRKIGTRVGASAIGGPLAPFIAAGSIIWTGWDIGKAIYDVFADEDSLPGLSDEDKATIKQHMAVLTAIEKDKEFMKTVDAETRKRVEYVMKGLNSLAVDTGYKPDGQAASPASQSTDAKIASMVRKDASGPTTAGSTTKGLHIAYEPVIPGQPLSQRQMAAIQASLSMGNNNYPPEVMAQYNRQRRD